MLKQVLGFACGTARGFDPSHAGYLKARRKTICPTGLHHTLFVGQAALSNAICASTRQLYVIARPDPQRYQFQVIAADLKAATARQLTGLGGGGIWQMSHVWLSDDCKRVFVTGGAFLSEARLFVMDPASPTRFRPITTVPRAIGPTLALTPDGSTLVYASGGGERRDDFEGGSLCG